MSTFPRYTSGTRLSPDANAMINFQQFCGKFCHPRQLCKFTRSFSSVHNIMGSETAENTKIFACERRGGGCGKQAWLRPRCTVFWAWRSAAPICERGEERGANSKARKSGNRLATCSPKKWKPNKRTIVPKSDPPPFPFPPPSPPLHNPPAPLPHPQVRLQPDLVAWTNTLGEGESLFSFVRPS
jgi:hypothetical protein